MLLLSLSVTLLEYLQSEGAHSVYTKTVYMETVLVIMGSFLLLDCFFFFWEFLLLDLMFLFGNIIYFGNIQSFKMVADRLTDDHRGLL